MSSTKTVVELEDVVVKWPISISDKLGRKVPVVKTYKLDKVNLSPYVEIWAYFNRITCPNVLICTESYWVSGTVNGTSILQGNTFIGDGENPSCITIDPHFEHYD